MYTRRADPQDGADDDRNAPDQDLRFLAHVGPEVKRKITRRDGGDGIERRNQRGDQDASYWPFSPSKTVTAWLAIDDADRENGCMQVIPTSHLHGQLSYRQSDDSEKNVLDQTVDRVEQYGAPVDIDLKAGQISLHSDLLLHSSEPNHSSRRRCGLTLRYCAAGRPGAGPSEQ